MTSPATSDAAALLAAARDALDRARREVNAPATAGSRERYRAWLDRAVALAEAAAAWRGDDHTSAASNVAVAEAHAARADNARYGAGQLARGAQRAPTPKRCEAGWRRVASIVADARSSARAARTAARRAKRRRADSAAERAEVAASAANELLEERNHAYTFHTDPRFSFGEGWYVAAAALLADVEVQLERGQPNTDGAERFLRDAGLWDRVVPARPRPRANKQLTSIVAASFRRDPRGSAIAVRRSFLGLDPVPGPVAGLLDSLLAGATSGPKVLLWVRTSAHDPHRNTEAAELAELARRARAAELVPVLFGDAPPGGVVPEGAIDLSLCWRRAPFRGATARRAQLQMFEHLRTRHGVAGQIGVTTAGMDGPALLGLPTLYLTDEPNVRMGRWVGAVPGYREVVRGPGYLDAVGRAFADLAQRQDGGRPR